MDLIVDLLRDADPARLGFGLDPGGDVHRVAENVLPRLFDIAQVNADANVDRNGGGARVPFMQAALDLYRALGGSERAHKLDEKAISGGLDLMPSIARDDRSDQTLLLAQKAKGPGFVGLGERREADRVREHDRRQPTCGGHGRT